MILTYLVEKEMTEYPEAAETMTCLARTATTGCLATLVMTGCLAARAQMNLHVAEGWTL
jgi:hypothetical protein